MKEWFQFRNDMLEQREVDHVDKVTVERFSHGRRFHLQRKSASSSCSSLYRLAFGFDFDVRGGTSETRPTTKRRKRPLTGRWSHSECVCLVSVHRFTDTERVTEFSSARLDYLVRRVERPGEMTEIFEGRCDRLYRRHVVFERQADGAEQDGVAGTEMKIPQVRRGCQLIAVTHWV